MPTRSLQIDSEIRICGFTLTAGSKRRRYEVRGVCARNGSYTYIDFSCNERILVKTAN